jgi:hypothetical protein
MARKLAMTTSKAIRSQRACTPPLVATFDFDGDVHFQLPIQAALRSQHPAPIQRVHRRRCNLKCWKFKFHETEVPIYSFMFVYKAYRQAGWTVPIA